MWVGGGQKQARLAYSLKLGVAVDLLKVPHLSLPFTGAVIRHLFYLEAYMPSQPRLISFQIS
jgi:hypothetical protein